MNGVKPDGGSNGSNGGGSNGGAERRGSAGSNGGCGDSRRGSVGGGEGGRMQWKVGLLNHQGRYLTAESFGSKINASATAMRKKQLWFIEQDKTDEDTVYIRRYVYCSPFSGH